MLEKGLFEEYEKCLQDEPAATTARCPVHVNVPEFCAELCQGNFKKAYSVLQRVVPFAGVMCLVCDAPCQEVCVRNELDTSVRLYELERAAVHYGRTPYKKKFKTTKTHGKIAVVGGGISGLSAAFDLDRRGYAVTLYEKTERLGGWLWDLVGTRLSAEDIDRGLEAIYELAIQVRYDQFIDTHKLQLLLDEYDAVFLGTGEWDEVLPVDKHTFRVRTSTLFAGGRLAGIDESLIDAVSSGKRAAISIERLLKGVSLTSGREREAAFVSLVPKSLAHEEPAWGSAPGEETHAPDSDSSAREHTLEHDIPERGRGFLEQPPLYSKDEAIQEARRCLQCTCDECIKACVHLQRYGRRPKTYAREIYTNENVFLGTRYANEMINSCALCGLCGERCPLDINMAPLISQTRRSMVVNEKMPPSAHDFALRDMAFSNSDHSSLVRQPPELLQEDCSKKASYLFFPGCQLAASEPEHVEAAYAWLRQSLPEEVGLFLGCCGAPANWAGRDDLLGKTAEYIRNVWEENLRPTFILACSSCAEVMKHALGEIETISLWELLATHPLPSRASVNNDTVLNVHDACATRYNHALQESVRLVLTRLGYQTEELRYSTTDTKCCGYGGMVFYANREQQADFAVDRAKESPHDLVVYCAMCKDLFIGAGKRSFHLLDLVFAENPEDYALRPMPSFSERQIHRSALKRKLLEDVWHEEQPVVEPTVPGYTITILPEVLERMEERLILISDVEDALARAVREPDERFFNCEDSSYLISLRKQYVTYWVRYLQTDKTIVVISTYSHRMDLVG